MLNLCSLRPWDPVNDITQYEQNFKVMTHTKHRTALVRQMSIVNVSSSEQSSRGKGRHTRQLRGRGTKVSDSSTPSHVSDTEEIDEGESVLLCLTSTQSHCHSVSLVLSLTSTQSHCHSVSLVLCLTSTQSH